MIIEKIKFFEISKNKFLIFKIIFFDEKMKVEKKIDSSFRCRILSGIHFWHPQMQQSIILEMPNGIQISTFSPLISSDSIPTSEILCAVRVAHVRLLRDVSCFTRFRDICVYSWRIVSNSSGSALATPGVRKNDSLGNFTSTQWFFVFLEIKFSMENDFF